MAFLNLHLLKTYLEINRDINEPNTLNNMAWAYESWDQTPQTNKLIRGMW